MKLGSSLALAANECLPSGYWKLGLEDMEGSAALLEHWVTWVEEILGL